MRRILPAVLLVAACAHGPKEDREDPVVDSLRVEGTRVADPSDLAEGLATRETGIWPWSPAQRLDPLALEADLRRIEAHYRRRGHYQARARAVTREKDGRAEVVITVEEGPPTRIASLAATGLPEPLRAFVLADLPLRQGEVLDANAYEEAQRLIRLRLAEAGYPEARVAGRVDIYPEQTRADVHLSIGTGPRVRYGPVEVVGLSTMPERAARRIVERHLPRGGVYDPYAVQEAQARVGLFGSFDLVRIGLADGGSDAASEEAERAVRVYLEEAPAHSVSAAGGLGVQQSVNRVQVELEYKNLNFLGGQRRLIWHNSLALVALPSFLDFQDSGLAGDSTLELTQPEVLPRVDAAGRVGFERQFRPGFEANSLAAQAGLPYHPWLATLVSPSVTYQRYFDVVGAETVGPGPPSLVTTCPAPCTLLYLEATVQEDHRQRPTSPRYGWLGLLTLQYGLGALGGQFNYVLFQPEVRLYVPLGRRLTLAGRAKLGALYTLGDTLVSPIVQRFFGGGQGDHRGFGAQQLSPLVQTDGDFVPIGGDGEWLASLEARVRLAARWGVVAFADCGNVTLEPLDLNLGNGHVALGVGARYDSPVGPIRADLGYRVDRQPRVAINTGRPREENGLDYLSFFVSIGEAF